MSLAVYEAFPFSGVDATVISATVDGVVMMTVTDNHPSRAVGSRSGPVIASPGANTRMAFSNFTANVIAAPLRLGMNTYFASGMHYAQFPYTSSNYGKSVAAQLM